MIKLELPSHMDSDRDAIMARLHLEVLELCLGVSPRIESYKILINLTLQGGHTLEWSATDLCDNMGFALMESNPMKIICLIFCLPSKMTVQRGSRWLNHRQVKPWFTTVKNALFQPHWCLQQTFMVFHWSFYEVSGLKNFLKFEFFKLSYLGWTLRFSIFSYLGCMPGISKISYLGKISRNALLSFWWYLRRTFKVFNFSSHGFL